MALYAEFLDSATGCSVVVDDDGRVAWAYLRDPAGDIIGDVWLYNLGDAPEVADFTDAASAPFPNPRGLCRPLDQPPPEASEDVTVEWTLEGDLLLADIFLRGVLLARLSPGSQPGWSSLATDNGPLARVLSN